MSATADEHYARLWWYEYDVLPLVGFVNAADRGQAEAAALDDAIHRLRCYLADSPVKLERIEPCRES